MPPSHIHFQREEGLVFSIKKKAAIIKWIEEVVRREGKNCGRILYFFCTDDYLLQINRDFLKHDTYTDIITFDYSTGDHISGEIYISVDRVKENALIYKQAFEKELMRTLIHGVLHLSGYTDKTTARKKEIRTKEDNALRLFYKASTR